MSEDDEPYLLHGGDGEGWVHPAPAGTAVREALLAETDLAAAAVEPLAAYVEVADIRALLEDGSGSLSFDVEGHEVRVEAGGQVTVVD